MSEKTPQSAESAKEKPLDLNSLSGLDFGPSWAGEKSGAGDRYKDYESRPKRPGGGKGRPPGRDRRTGGAPAHRSGEGGRSGPRPRDDRGGRPPREQPFEPTVEVNLYPQDEAFDALIKRLRSTARTYQLFEITQLLLEKPERFVVVVARKKQSRDGGKPAPLYFSVPGHLPFETEEAAISHVLKHHLDRFFDIEEIEVDPPKGNFPMVNRCTLTGALLGPPNYHRYQEFVQRHYANQIHGMAFDRYLTKIETVKDPEVIAQWMESMKKGFRYTLKERAEGEPESFESLDAVRLFLIQHRKDQVVGSADSVRFAGVDIQHMPKGDLRRSVEAYIEHQRHFPLESANNIRGRLRRHKFTVYKKGSKGVSFVCAVKRKFRDGKTVFTDSIRDLIEFIEKHPEIPASKLPKEFIGIDTEKRRPEKLKMAEGGDSRKAASGESEDSEAKAASPAAESAPESAAEAAPEAAGEAQPAPREGEATSGEAKPEVRADVEVTPKDELTPEEQKRLNQLMIDLRWLITEGYVTEYGDGRLFAPPPMPEPKKESPETKPAAATKAPQKPVSDAGAEAAPEPETPAASEPESAAAPQPEAAPAVEAASEKGDSASTAPGEASGNTKPAEAEAVEAEPTEAKPEAEAEAAEAEPTEADPSEEKTESK